MFRRISAWIRKLFRMRRKISLYIGDRKAELSDGSFLLFNYAMEEMSNPTIVKNSYSQQITLPGTSRNNKIFGGIFRPDRVTQYGGSLDTGIYFDPARKTPFTIYNELGEVMESGYCKLDSIQRKRGNVEYSVTLYGGLGSFMYSLSYDDAGKKRTLADLAYMGEGSDASELDFKINAKAVRDAWYTIAGRDVDIDEVAVYRLGKINEDGTVGAGQRGDVVKDYRIVGGMMYQVTGTSLQDGCLAAVLDAEGNTLQTFYYGTRQSYTRTPITAHDDGVILRVCGNAPDGPAVSGLAGLWDILNFAPCYNGTPSGDFSADKVMFSPTALGMTIPSGYSTMNGYALGTLSRDYTEWEVKDLRSYLQRPVIKWSKVIEAICAPYNNGGYSVNLDADFFNENNPYYADAWLTLPILSTLNVQSQGVEGSLIPVIGEVTLPDSGSPTTEYTINLQILPRIYTDTASPSYYMHCLSGSWYALNFGVITVVAYDADGNELARTSGAFSSANPTWAQQDSSVPTIEAVGQFNEEGKWVGNGLRLSLEASGVSYLQISQTFGTAMQGTLPFEPQATDVYTDIHNYQSNKSATHDIERNSEGCSYRYGTTETARTGAIITKKMLLSSERTPADYLLSYCKMFGLVFTADKASKTINITRRSNFYSDGLLNITPKVDIAEGVKLAPFAFTAKWYDFKTDYSEGEFAKYYANVYEKTFGMQRVDTGYEFNSTSVNLLDGSAFKGLIDVLEKSPAFVNYVNGSYDYPAVFAEGGKYELTNGSGDTEEFDLPLPTASMVKSNINADYPGSDTWAKPQIHNADNAPFEHRDALLFLTGTASPSGRYCLTDDTATMMALNDSVPCWFISDDADSVVSFVPKFSRYIRNGNTITKSWDFGTPSEVLLPDAEFAEDSGIYAQFWETYIRDRYDDDTKVMTAKVDLTGMQVNEQLFRTFYWYDGAIWAMNKITNHSMTTWDATECEFVRVMEKDNYLI